MRPAHIHADISAQQYHELQHALHHQWRPATRAVMVVLSADGMPPTEIGALLHYSPTTVRRWIARHDIEGLVGLTDRPRSGRPQANALLKLSVARLA
jgi:transposase